MSGVLRRNCINMAVRFRKKTALLVNPNEKDLGKLFELFAQNQGFTINAFSVFESAVDRLLCSNDTD